MGIYIKDMEKPKSCDQCPIFLYALPKDCYLEIGMCPIMEIKTPHGRLIDADRLKVAMNVFPLGVDMDTIDYDIEKVDNAPTVIGAEME